MDLRQENEPRAGVSPCRLIARRTPNVIAIAFAILALGCGPSVKRDLSAIPVGQVGFDDLCGLQGYYDQLAMKTERPPDMVDGADVERVSELATSRGGRARFAFQTPFQLATVRRVLDENWKRLPPHLGAAKRIEISVNWSERAGLHRVATNSDPELVVDGVATALPYHVCLSELLFGEPLYHQRRSMLGLAPLPAAHSLALQPTPDAGATPVDGGTASPPAPASPKP